MAVEQGLPYVRYSLCHHAQTLGNMLMNRTPVTIWNKITKHGREPMFNHIENGWCADMCPTPKSERQIADWLHESVSWERVYGYLIDGKVVEIEK